jgi:hypothetical protein
VRAFRRCVVALAVLALTGACSHGSKVVERPLGTTTTTVARRASGVIVGRMYVDGGGPCCDRGSEPVFGEITIRSESAPFALVHPRQDRRGNFRAALAPGSYRVTGRPTDGFSSVTFSTVLVVHDGASSYADFGVVLL